MKKLKQLCTATALTLILAFTALAGDMQTPPFVPTPDPIVSTGNVNTKDVTAGGTVSGDVVAIDSVDITLFLIDSMMTSVF